MLQTYFTAGVRQSYITSTNNITGLLFFAAGAIHRRIGAIGTAQSEPLSISAQLIDRGNWVLQQEQPMLAVSSRCSRWARCVAVLAGQ